MKAFCPNCSTPITTDLLASVCPECQRKYRVFAGKIEQSFVEKGGGFWSYQVVVKGQKSHLLRIKSMSTLPIREGQDAVFIFYGPEALGFWVEGVWRPIPRMRQGDSLFKKYLRFLPYPITALALLQGIRFLIEGKELIQSSPETALFFIIFILFIGLTPILWWIIETLFPEGPPQSKTAIPDLFDDEAPWKK